MNHRKKWVISALIVFTLSLVIFFHYYGYAQAKEACLNINGTITEDEVSLFNWSVSCES
ncbi:hypothetical protein LCM20_16125 [Halobacillus litoralis]|uniref:hypothetical protein n=1 Tax=Halobacillus litoralis TaxID=45668 RepID=UPI001CD1D4AA|nr:hypothetical protein [Halobacillus litoralis]MCA0972135.1 hypothetical protein [Halobacillus litoralis]